MDPQKEPGSLSPKEREMSAVANKNSERLYSLEGPLDLSNDRSPLLS